MAGRLGCLVGLLLIRGLTSSLVGQCAIYCLLSRPARGLPVACWEGVCLQALLFWSRPRVWTAEVGLGLKRFSCNSGDGSHGRRARLGAAAEHWQSMSGCQAAAFYVRCAKPLYCINRHSCKVVHRVSFNASGVGIAVVAHAPSLHEPRALHSEAGSAVGSRGSG